MKNLIKFMFVFLALGVVVASCSDDDDDKSPKILNLEVGHNHDSEATANDHIAHIGEDLHVEAEIFAPNKIAKIVIAIHEEGEHHDHATTKAETKEWEFEKVYTDLAGQLNGKFHHHIDVPATAEPGKYHFHIKVVDQAGLTVEKEEELTLEVEEE